MVRPHYVKGITPRRQRECALWDHGKYGGAEAMGA